MTTIPQDTQLEIDEIYTVLQHFFSSYKLLIKNYDSILENNIEHMKQITIIHNKLLAPDENENDYERAGSLNPEKQPIEKQAMRTEKEYISPILSQSELEKKNKEQEAYIKKCKNYIGKMSKIMTGMIDYTVQTDQKAKSLQNKARSIISAFQNKDIEKSEQLSTNYLLTEDEKKGRDSAFDWKEKLMKELEKEELEGEKINSTIDFTSETNNNTDSFLNYQDQNPLYQEQPNILPNLFQSHSIQSPALMSKQSDETLRKSVVSVGNTKGLLIDHFQFDQHLWRVLFKKSGYLILNSYLPNQVSYLNPPNNTYSDENEIMSRLIKKIEFNPRFKETLEEADKYWMESQQYRENKNSEMDPNKIQLFRFYELFKLEKEGFFITKIPQGFEHKNLIIIDDIDIDLNNVSLDEYIIKLMVDENSIYKNLRAFEIINALIHSWSIFNEYIDKKNSELNIPTKETKKTTIENTPKKGFLGNLFSSNERKEEEITIQEPLYDSKLGIVIRLFKKIKNINNNILVNLNNLKEVYDSSIQTGGNNHSLKNNNVKSKKSFKKK